MDFTAQQIQALHAQLREHLGPVVCAALEDETVTDIKCSDGVVWLVKHQLGDVRTEGFLSEHERRLAVNLMARLRGKHVNAESPRLRVELVWTGNRVHRVQGFVPPVAPPSFYIRRHAPEVFTWADYVNKKIMDPWQVDVLRAHIQKRSNIGFSGATGSGKTTLLNTAIGEIVDSQEHVTILEDTPEIRCESPNVTRLVTNDTVSLQQLVIDAMRVAPKRIVVGEVRGAEGVSVMEALSTGHGGCMFTVHANSARGVFERFAQFCQQAGLPPLWRLMQSTFGLIVHMEMTPLGRRVVAMEEVTDEHIEPIPVGLKRLGPIMANGLTHPPTPWKTGSAAEGAR